MGYRNFIESEAIRIAKSVPGDVFPDVDFSIPDEYHNEVMYLLRAAAASDAYAPAGDPMAAFGKWHRAANVVQAELRSAGVAYMGSWSHRALMRVAAAMEG